MRVIKLPTRGIKHALANLALVFASLAVTYGVLEVVFFRIILPDLPLAFRLYLPDRADFFLQISKSQYVPKDYIALVGDSYAQGQGDWLMSQGGKAAQPYHSADVIHELLGRDVASYGRAAAGSAEAMVLRVTRVLGDENCFLFPAIEIPKQFFVYFYEGNDLDDNYKLVAHRIQPTETDIRPQIDEFLDYDYGSVSNWRCHGHLGDTIWKIIQFHLRFGLNPDLTYNIGPVPPINRIIVGGVNTNARELNVPSLALDDAQLGTGFIIYERALAWLRRQYPQVPTTVVYIPSSSAVYRHASDKVVAFEFYDPNDTQVPRHPHVSTGRRFSVEAVYANSQTICEHIRAITLGQSVGFLDARPALRAAATVQALHGPRDWNHFNEAGYRVLGKLVADYLREPPLDACDDIWPPA
jgi:hypothetical protein